MAVDREAFSSEITKKIKENKNIITHVEEVDSIDENAITVVATGPLTTPKMMNALKSLVGADFLYFYDAASPIISAESIDYNVAFFASRYNKGDADYLNCPMNKEEFEAFWQALVSAETAHVKDFEENMVFEGCMPVEVMAKRGKDTIRFGPLKPVGLTDPATGKRPWAVLQLRKENNFNTMYNLVGFQTHLTFPEQRRVFRMIPALAEAEFVRYGVMHKNTYINSPDLLDKNFALKHNQNIYFAGQISGVEGYVESIASGLTAGISVAMRLSGRPVPDFSSATIIGALGRYVSSAESKYFQPMNANFGILEGLGYDERDKQKKKSLLAARSLDEIRRVYQSLK